MTIVLKRAYEDPSPGDGYRVLVERLWPRGLTKQHAKIDLWAKDAAPSAELRRWFRHDPAKWAEFKSRYFSELSEMPEVLELLVGRARQETVTFVFSSRELRFNNAVALKEYIEDSM